MENEGLRLIPMVEATERDALVIVDVQNDFIPGGALSVEGGDEIIMPINALTERFSHRGGLVVMTQDWHPRGHSSFASSHGLEPFTAYESEGVGPILWPDHCVQQSWGAEFNPSLKSFYAHAIIRKGYRQGIDSYSAFLENDKKTYTGLHGYLKSVGIRRILLCGLALDYCVYYSAIDGRKLGFEVVIPVDLSRAINKPPGRLSNAISHMAENGVHFTLSKNIITG